MLATYPDCTRPYFGGPNVGTSVFVVGRNTEHEKLFRKNQFEEAEDWAVEHKVWLENTPTTALCYDAIVDLLGA